MNRLNVSHGLIITSKCDIEIVTLKCEFRDTKLILGVETPNSRLDPLLVSKKKDPFFKNGRLRNKEVEDGYNLQNHQSVGRREV